MPFYYGVDRLVGKRGCGNLGYYGNSEQASHRAHGEIRFRQKRVERGGVCAEDSLRENQRL